MPFPATDSEWCERYDESPFDLAALRDERERDECPECGHSTVSVTAPNPWSGVTESACEAPDCDWSEAGR